MVKYKLIKHYPGNDQEIGSIVTSLGDGYYVTDDNDYIPCSIVENEPEFWQKLEPLFYAEDFISGALPACNEKGDAVYEGDNTWLVIIDMPIDTVRTIFLSLFLKELKKLPATLFVFVLIEEK